MTYLKLSIPKINESIDQYKEHKKHVLEDVSLVYNSMGYVDSCWNDSNSINFINKLKMDKYQVNEYFNYLDTLYSEIMLFKNNIDDIYHKFGYKRNSIEIKFDDSNIANIKQYLNDSVALIDNSLNQINISLFPQEFESLNLVYTLRSELKKMKAIIKSLIDDIDYVDKNIKDEISDSKYRLNKKINHNYRFKTVEYNWKTTIGKFNAYNEPNIEQKYNTVGTNNIKSEINSKIENFKNANVVYNVPNTNVKEESRHDVNLSKHDNIYSGQDNSFKYEDSIQMDKFNDNVKVVYAAPNSSVEQKQYDFNRFKADTKYDTNADTVNLNTTNMSDITHSDNYEFSENTINLSSKEDINLNTAEQYEASTQSASINNNETMNFNIGNMDYTINSNNVNINTNLK